jgi:hypothetical protein
MLLIRKFPAVTELEDSFQNAPESEKFYIISVE